MALEIKVNVDTNKTKIERILSPEKFAKVQVQKTLKKIGNLYIKTLREKRMDGRPGLNRRSGELAKRKRFNLTVKQDGEDYNLAVTVGKGLKYANIQETGGVISAKKAKLLAIPLDDPLVRTSKGIARYKSPEDVPGELFVVESERGSLFLAKEVRGDLRLLYILKKTVKIPARLGARKVAQGEITNFKINAIRMVKELNEKLTKKLGAK